MTNNKIPEELYNEVKNINEQAYKFALDIWSETDKLDGSEAEDQKTKNFDERIWHRLDTILDQWEDYIS